MSSMNLVRTHTLEDEAFLRKVTFSEEDRRQYIGKPYTGGYRWFRNPHIIPIEHWRRPKASAIQQPRTAA
jgi:hypothetical protein